MTGKMTPGEWRQHPVDETEVYTAGLADRVATTYRDDADYRENYARREADARAIAALPKLIEIARMAVNACDILADECREAGDRHETIWRAKAANARAALKEAGIGP